MEKSQKHSFRIKKGKAELPALDVLKGGHYHRKYAKNRELCEYFVPVDWLQTLPLDEAVDEIGLFGNQKYHLSADSAEMASHGGSVEGEVSEIRQMKTPLPLTMPIGGRPSATIQ